MTNPIKFSLVLPTFNERDNIVPLVTRLRELYDTVTQDYEIIIVDDNSPDGTAETVRNAFNEDKRIRLIVRKQDPGLALSIREGIEQVRGEIILVMDTDFNHKPDDALTLCQITPHVDLAIGSRFIFGGGMSSPVRYLLSYLYNIFLRIVLGTRLDENLSGFFAIKREAMQKLDYDKIFWGYGDYFFRLLLLSQRAGLRHVELPVHYGVRASGDSKTGFLSIFGQYTHEVIWLIVKKATGRW